METTDAATMWAVLGLATLLLIRHILRPHLRREQLRHFDIVIVPLLGAILVHGLAEFLGAVP